MEATLIGDVSKKNCPILMYRAVGYSVVIYASTGTGIISLRIISSAMV